MATETRVFGGKRYKLWDYGTAKSTLSQVAGVLRQSGVRARLVPAVTSSGDKYWKLYTLGSKRDWARFFARNLLGLNK